MIRGWTLVLFALALCAGPLAAQAADYAVHPWSTRDGLPQNTITGIDQMPDGFLWLTTYGGLARFDGSEFEIFDVSNSPALGSSRLTALAVDEAGALFVGTAKGDVLRKLGPGWLKLELPGDHSSRIQQLLEDGRGGLWIQRAVDLLRLEAGQSTAVRVYAGATVGLAINRGGLCFAGVPAGILALGDGPPRAIGTPGMHPLKVGQDGLLYIENAAGLHSWDGRSITKLPIGGSQHRFLSSHPGGRLWFAAGHELSWWDPERAELHPLDVDLGLPPDERLLRIFEDGQDNLWVGTQTRGLLELSPSPLGALVPKRSIDPTRLTVANDGRGRVYAMGAKLWRVEHQKLIEQAAATPLRGASSAGDGLWLLTELGLGYMTDNGFEIELDQQHLPAAVGAMLEARDGTLWIAAEGELLHWNGERLQRFEFDSSAGYEAVLYEDRSGRIWSGGTAGLRVWDGARASTFLANEDLPPGEVRGLFESDQGAMWVGTYGGGLARIDGRDVRLIDTDNGLFENTASALVPDGQGRLVVLGNRAIVSYSIARLGAVARGERERVFGRVFDSGPGIDVFEGNGIFGSRFATDATGTIWFPSLHGVARFSPSKVRPIAPPSTTHVLIAVRKPAEFRHDRDGGGTYVLPPVNRELQLHFSSPSYIQPRQVHYRYRLAGQEREWIYTSKQGLVAYSDLLPGGYTFEIESAVADSPYRARANPIRIEVPPLWFERAWVRTSGMLLALTLVGGLGVVRVRAFRRRNERLELRVAQRTLELQDEVNERRRAEEGLRQAGEQLEEQVALRTSELAHALTNLEWDICRREKLEGRLRESEKLEAIGRLAGGLAHDFNNILTAILGETDLAQANLATIVDMQRLQETLEQHLGNVRDAGLRAARLTRQLLAYSRQQIMQPKVVDPLVTLEELQTMLRRLVPDDVEIAVAADSASLPVLIDPGQLEQVIVNLVVNAAEAMPSGGQIELACSVVHEQDGQASTVVRVSDTGTGLTEEDRGRIFEPFFSTKGKARGLGLASVQGIVLQSGGSLEVDSEPGLGTTFQVALPVTDKRPSEHRDERAVSQAKQLFVLLVDDEDDVRRITRKMLERSGMTVIDASTPFEALELARTHESELDVLVTDVVMPHMNGKQLGDAVRSLCPAVKVLFISGYSSEVLSDRDLLERGANLLPKPFDAHMLAARLAALA